MRGGYEGALIRRSCEDMPVPIDLTEVEGEYTHASDHQVTRQEAWLGCSMLLVLIPSMLWTWVLHPHQWLAL